LAVLPLEPLVQRALGWLQAHPGWLLVLDDLTDPEDAAVVLDRPMPGRMLVTSRLGEGWSHRYGARVLHLDVLPEDKAVELLAGIADRTGGAGLEGAAELVAELGWLPLAIEQAGAYLHQTSWCCSAQSMPHVIFKIEFSERSFLQVRAVQGHAAP
jgi:hypothetical protein